MRRSLSNYFYVKEHGVMSLRSLLMAVAVVHDERKRFLLCFNQRWQGHVFPMKRAERSRDLGRIAVEALEDCLGQPLPSASVEPMEHLFLYGYSHGVDEDTLYDYHIFEVRPGADLNPRDFGDQTKFLAYDELVDSPGVTWPTKDIARALVKHQEVALAVISREAKSAEGELETQLLMVRKASYHGYFFPVMRLKAEFTPERVAVSAVHADTGYAGPIEASWSGNVDHKQYSPRYDRKRRFRFHICKIALPGVDLSVQGNALEAALETMAEEKRDPEYWGWFGTAQLEDPNTMSPTVEAVRSAVIQTTEVGS
jgi:hypothetical protein